MLLMMIPFLVQATLNTAFLPRVSRERASSAVASKGPAAAELATSEQASHVSQPASRKKRSLV